MLMLPLAEACWLTWRLLPVLALPLGVCPGSSSASARFLLPREERVPEVLEDVARETVMRDGGLGDSLSLAGKQEGAGPWAESCLAKEGVLLGPQPFFPHPPKGLLLAAFSGPRRRLPFLFPFQQLPVRADLHVQGQLDVQQLLVLH